MRKFDIKLKEESLTVDEINVALDMFMKNEIKPTDILFDRISFDYIDEIYMNVTLDRLSFDMIRFEKLDFHFNNPIVKQEIRDRVLSEADEMEKIIAIIRSNIDNDLNVNGVTLNTIISFIRRRC